jgi:hypothetical protein
VTFNLKASDLAYWDEAGNRWKVEAEPVEIEAAASSADVRVVRTLRVE